MRAEVGIEVVMFFKKDLHTHFDLLVVSEFVLDVEWVVLL